MTLNPGLAEQLVSRRREDLEHAAHAPHQGVTAAAPASATATPSGRPHPAVTRHLGVLLIVIGRRLAGAEAFSATFDHR
jgi:hypothetical protein